MTRLRNALTIGAIAALALLLTPLAGLSEGRYGDERDGGAQDGQAGDLDPWDEVDGVTAATGPGPTLGDGKVVEEGCDCDTEQCSQAPGAMPVAGAAGLLLIKRRRRRRP